MELVDLYDRDRLPTGKVGERHESFPEGFYRLVVHLAVFDEDNRLLIQQRAENKSFGGMWDLTVGGGVQKGETSSQAMEREALEELGLKLDFSKIRPILTANFSQGFDDFYLLSGSKVKLEDLTLLEEEVQDTKFASLEELLEIVKGGRFFPYKENFLRLLFDLALDDRIIED